MSTKDQTKAWLVKMNPSVPVPYNELQQLIEAGRILATLRESSTIENLRLREALIDIEKCASVGLRKDCTDSEARGALLVVRRKAADALPQSEEYLFGISDEQLIRLWESAGGSFHGPNAETGTIPQEQLLPFLRRLLPTTERQTPPNLAAYAKAHRHSI